MALRFEKYQGIGNDFIVVEAESPESLSAEQAQILCDRHFGLGADGVLLASRDPGGEPRMTVLNSDGSRPEMCGNGLRCIALHEARRRGGTQSSFIVQTDAGPRPCEVELRNEDEGLVRTELGRGSREGELSWDLDGEKLRFLRISMGNPHAVCFHPPISDGSLDKLGPQLSRSIPLGTNVEIVSLISSHELKVHVWERGVGRTLACGTGAAASVVAAVLEGHAAFGEAIVAHLPGGPLEVTVSPKLEVSLRGPAAWVMRGETKLI